MISTGILQVSAPIFGKRYVAPKGATKTLRATVKPGSHQYTLIDGVAILHRYTNTHAGPQRHKIFINLADVIKSGAARIIRTF